MARTTLIIDDACMRKLKQIAHEDHKTLTAVVSEMLVDGIHRREDRPRASRPVVVPSFSMGEPKVDLADRDALEEAMD